MGDVQYRGDIMMHMGGYHEYHRGCSVSWGYTSPLKFEYRGGGGGEALCVMCVQYRGVLRTVGVFSTMGDIMSTVGDILNIVGCSVLWGIS